LYGSYEPWLVACSLIVAMLAAYTALTMASRVSTAQGSARRGWLAGGACAMGFGIWSMHFIGMLSFRLPVPLGYDLAITFYSLLLAVAASAFALWLVSRERLPVKRLLLGAGLMGAGIASMHYVGMAALRMQPGIDYDLAWLAASIAIAIAASGAALWIAFRLRASGHRRLLRAAAAATMGVAIVGMHYTGMAAARFAPDSWCGAARDGGVPVQWLAVLVIVVTLAILGIALIVSVLDRQMQSRTSRLARSLAQANEELVKAALHDALTGLPNRVLLQDRIAQAVAKAEREEGRFAVLFMDLDGFKHVNDAYGHQTGDALLVQMAARIRSMMRAHDTLSRLGGDEFVMVLDDALPEDAAAFAERLLVAARLPFVMDGIEARVSCSVGIALFPEDARDERALMASADAAMYHAKENGRNGYAFFAPSMTISASEQLRLLNDLRGATANGELVLHYQPKFISPDRPVVGAEALLRWQHPVRGLVGPDAFIPVAEKSGLILPIGEWVLDETCRQIRQWRDQGLGIWNVAVNLSPVQFNSAQLVRTVQQALDRHGVDPDQLTLEITESTAMQDADASLEILRDFTRMGVRISIDDFGTGYSSLLYLKRLPASEIKIDRAFVRDLESDPEDATIVASIIALGHSLNLKVVAEGVETAGQQAYLSHLGCDYLQGFLLGRPVPADRFMAQVRAHADAFPQVEQASLALPPAAADATLCATG